MNEKKVIKDYGSNKKKNFEVLDVLSKFRNEKNLNIYLGIAYNPYLQKHYNNFEEKVRFEKKISLGLIKSLKFFLSKKSLI